MAGRSLLFVVLAAASASSAASYKLQIKENISIPLPPGFTVLSPHLPGKLVVSSFEATPFIGKNGVFMADVGKTSGPAQELPGTNVLNWPNSLTVVNRSVFGFTAIALGDGFLVPSHTTGGVYVMEASLEPQTLKQPAKLTQDKKGWFYHQAEFLDVDGDGLEDIVTARCQFSVFPWVKKQGELVWLKHPAKDVFSAPWAEESLGFGPDFLFCMKPGKNFALVAPEYITGKVVYWYRKDGQMATRILDHSIGPGFSCSWEDLNNDGQIDLLVTNHAMRNGSVFAYTFSSEEIESATLTRHTLASGFQPVKVKQGSASPGDAVAFRPRVAETTSKPWIFVSGDNSNSIFLLQPSSESADDWHYVTSKVADLAGDVGRPSIADVDVDGLADIFVPLYDARKVAHYHFTEVEDSESLEIQV